MEKHFILILDMLETEDILAWLNNLKLFMDKSFPKLI